MQNESNVLYGPVPPHRVLSFAFCLEDTSADHPTRVSMSKITEFLNAAAVLT